MRIHPLLRDPNAVLVVQSPLSAPVAEMPVAWDDYRQAAWQAMTAMQIELEGERVRLTHVHLVSGRTRVWVAEGGELVSLGAVGHPAP